MSLPGQCFEMVREKWQNFKTKFWPVLRRFKLETEDDRDFVGDCVVFILLMILISTVIYSICYLIFEFKTVRL